MYAQVERRNNQPSICHVVPIIDGAYQYDVCQYNNQPGWMIREWYNKQMAWYEQCIGINLNRQNQHYTTINGRSISIVIFPIWYMSYNNQPAGWIIREWYNKQMARYEQCIGINLNRQNQNYTTINGRSISIGIFPNMIYVIYNNQPGYHFNSDFCRLWRHPKRDQSKLDVRWEN